MSTDTEYIMEPYFEQSKVRKRKRKRVTSKKSRMSHTQYVQTKRLVLDKQGDGRFYYFKDRYALMLLSYFVGEGKTVREIKQSPYGKLLSKPVLKELLARRGGSCITRDDLACVWPVVPECFHITLGDWGSDSEGRVNTGCYQTSRPGKNLVVLLNFSNTHSSVVPEGLSCDLRGRFCYEDHPHAKGRDTLAWSRIDIAEDMSEALIEEVQNDWLRHAGWYLQFFRDGKKPHGVSPKEHRCLARYATAVLERYAPIWQEAMLMAAIQVLKDDLGIGAIFYHTFEGGNVLKDMVDDFAPPRSIYTQLPKRFCFQPTTETPAMLEHELDRLQDRKGRRKRVLFQKLEL